MLLSSHDPRMGRESPCTAFVVGEKSICSLSLILACNLLQLCVKKNITCLNFIDKIK